MIRLKDWSVLRALKPPGTLWLVGYWLGTIPIKVKVSMAQFDFCTTLAIGTIAECKFFAPCEKLGKALQKLRLTDKTSPYVTYGCLQCFDAAGLAAGRACGL